MARTLGAWSNSAGTRSSTRRVTWRRKSLLPPQPQRDLDIVGVVGRHAVVQLHQLVEAVGVPAAHEGARPGHDRRAQREGLQAGVAAAVVQRVEHDVADRHQAEEVGQRHLAQEADAPRHVRPDRRDAPAQQLVQVAVAPREQHHQPLAVAPQQLDQRPVEVGVDLEQALRADIEMGVVGQAEGRARLRAGPAGPAGRSGWSGRAGGPASRSSGARRPPAPSRRSSGSGRGWGCRWCRDGPRSGTAAAPAGRRPGSRSGPTCRCRRSTARRAARPRSAGGRRPARPAVRRPGRRPPPGPPAWRRRHGGW